jgi:anaerobic dimethyl sulfoxide reductase subunit C
VENKIKSLTLFTWLTQAGIGLAIVNQVLGVGGEVGTVATIWVLLVTGISMLVSVASLGDPIGAYRALFNLKTSWLSREILFLGIFFALEGTRLYVGLWGTDNILMDATGWLAAFFGCLCLFSMSSIYVKTLIPAWGTWYTYVAFLSTAIILGSILEMAVAVRVSPDIAESLSIKVFLFISGGILLQLIGMVAYLPMLQSLGKAGSATLKILSDMTPIMIVSQVLTLSGGLGLPFLAYFTWGGGVLEVWVYASLFSLSIGQLMARHVYFKCGVQR